MKEPRKKKIATTTQIWVLYYFFFWPIFIHSTLKRGREEALVAGYFCLICVKCVKSLLYIERFVYSQKVSVSVIVVI